MIPDGDRLEQLRFAVQGARHEAAQYQPTTPVIALDELLPLIDRLEERPVVHLCPLGHLALTTCCGKTPFELPHEDRLTLHPELATCGGAER